MLRIFLPLYLILAVFFISFALAVQFLPDILLSDRFHKSAERMSRGTFYLIEKELEGLSYHQQQVAINNIQPYFKFPIYLLESDDVLIDENMRRRLLAGEVAQSTKDDADNIFKRMQSSDKVIALYFSDTQSELDHKEAAGTYHLINKILLNHPQQEWHRLIDELQMHFGIPIRLTASTDVQLEVKEQQRFDNRKIIALDHETDRWRFIGKLANSGYALTIGPIEQAITPIVLLSIIFLSLILFLALALFIWFRPLWRSINELSNMADNFGSGQLQARVTVKKMAVLGNLASQFNEMADRIEGLVSEHRELTNAVSHELRTPIARMRFGLDMLEDGDKSETPRFMASLNTDVDDLEILVNELLHYARFEKSNPMEQQQKVEIMLWLKSIIENAQGYAGDLTITLHTQQISNHLQLLFSEQYMARAIHNLLRNACRYGRENIDVTLVMNKPCLLIHIDDDGDGIAEKDRKRIFEAFTRVDKSRNKRSGGHGLGLAIAEKIMIAHKGSIAVSDSPLGGARFTLVLSV